jgi:hypothetical protein
MAYAQNRAEQLLWKTESDADWKIQGLVARIERNLTQIAPKEKHCGYPSAGESTCSATACRARVTVPLHLRSLSRRFVKKQHMQWTLRGAHLLLQTRTKVLNNELGDVFRRWYPRFRDQAA